MKYLYLILCVTNSFLLQAQIINIPDPNFKNQLVLSSDAIPYQLAKDASGNWLAVDSNEDGEIQLSEAQQLEWLFVSSAFGSPYVPVASLEGIASFTNMKTLDINGSNLTTLDFSGCTALESIDINTALSLQSISFSGLANIESIILDNSPAMQSINLTGNIALKYIDMNNTPGIPDLTNLLALETLIYTGVDTPFSINVSGLPNLKSVDCGNANLTSINLSGAIMLETLKVGNASLTELDVSGLPALKTLSCSNNLFTELDLTAASALQTISCGSSTLTSLNVQNLSNLQTLQCNFTQLNTIDLTGLSSLKTLTCLNGSITSLPLDLVPTLTSLNCSTNPISSLDLSVLPMLKTLDCSSCDISTLDFTNCTAMESLTCSSNLITTLDVSGLRLLTSCKTNYNPLIYLNAKNGANEIIQVNGCTSLQYICADENQIVTVQQSLINWNLPNCNINSYCTFTPGGAYSIVSGNTKVDGNNNGCDVSDIGYPHLNIQVSSGSENYSVMGNALGSYSYPVADGTYTLTPSLENSEYFTITPASVSVIFPEQPTP